MNDVYHYIPIAAKLGRTNKACGADLKFAVENSIVGTFHPDPAQWTSGWMFGYSGLSYDVDGCDGFMGATAVWAPSGARFFRSACEITQEPSG